LKNQKTISEPGVDELIAVIFNASYQRFLYYKVNAQKLSSEFQLDAMKWLSIMAYMMMNKSGALCPGISVPLIEVDMDNQDDGDRNSEKVSSTIKLRADILASDIVDFWCVPAYM